MIKNRLGEHFQFALILILLSITISLIAFLSEDKNKISGFAASLSYNAATNLNLREFNTIGELQSLGKGDYYIDDNGIVYLLDDESKPAIAKIKFVPDVSKNREIYIDNDGNIGYILS